MKRAILLGLISLAFLPSKNPDMDYLDSLFPQVKLHGRDTVHIGVDGYVSGTFDTIMTQRIHSILQVDSSSNYEIGYESFAHPVMRSKMNGQSIYVVEVGDTNHVSIYQGKDVWLYVYKKQTGFFKYFLLAGQHAGEGPWYETNSWFTDLNHDGRTDILTREIGEDPGEREVNGVVTWDIWSVDYLSAVTLTDTGFVDLPLGNPDSLRSIYKCY